MREEQRRDPWASASTRPIAAALRAKIAVPELDPRWFSFNTKQGRCDRAKVPASKAAPQRSKRARPRRARHATDRAFHRSRAPSGWKGRVITRCSRSRCHGPASWWRGGTSRATEVASPRPRGASSRDASRSSKKWGSPIYRSIVRPARYRGARCSAFDCRRSSGRGSRERSTFSTSRPSAFMREIPSAFWATCRRSPRPVRRCWWSSMTPR